MEEFRQEPPFVAIPTYIPEDEISVISQCFPETSEVQVIYGDKLPTIHLAPPVEPVVTEFLAWIVEFGPNLIKDVAAWALATYAGKKVIDGFAGEAGKDMWTGVKALGRWLLERVKKGESKYDKKGPILNLSARGAPDDGQPSFYLVNISFSVQSENIYDEVEQFLFPFIACVSHDAKAVTLWIEQKDNPIWPWEISDFHNRTGYRVNIQQGRFMNVFGISHRRHENTERCFKELSLQETDWREAYKE